MTKAEIMALLADKKDDEDVGELGTKNPTPPIENPKPSEIKADTKITGTAAELINLLSPFIKKDETPKPEEEDSAEVYI